MEINWNTEFKKINRRKAFLYLILPAYLIIFLYVHTSSNLGVLTASLIALVTLITAFITLPLLVIYFIGAFAELTIVITDLLKKTLLKYLRLMQ
jgi:hypothetical protein